MISRDDHRKLQRIYLQMLKDFHAFCVSNNLQYYLIAGSALGAMRHKGFIPWDVDVDVAMPRCDYQRFDELCRMGILPGSYEYTSYKNNKNHYLSHALLLLPDSSIVFHEDGRQTPMFLDIAPLDKLPEDPGKAQRTFSEVKRITWIISGKQNMQHLGQSKYKRVLKKIAQIMLKPIPLSTLNRLRDKAMMKYEDDACSFLVNYAGKYSMEKDSSPCWVFGEPTLVEFEGVFFYAPEKLDLYLTRMYGDYRKLPSEADQKRSWDEIESVRFPLAEQTSKEQQ